MLFNSLDFALFLPVVFVLYWFVLGKSYSKQNFFLLVSSYFFYACWDIRFLGLLLFSTAFDFFAAACIQNAQKAAIKKFWLYTSIAANITFLGFFKYYNFFAVSAQESLSLIGISVPIYLLQVVLPVGISFYTFHGLSYIVDVYKNRIEAEKDLIAYGLFVSYFPLLVAGPIERATHLLPQLKRERSFNYVMAASGMYQILWGLFKKIVIADQCAVYVNSIFSDSSMYSGSTLLVGAVFFAFQIYGDFSGYSDIALGVSKLFGIELLQNFSFPYFSRDIAEFWRRWHISLSSWFKDYVYIPLGGSKRSVIITIRNVFIIFLLSGFWHGANWTFIVWGLLHALYFLPSLLLGSNRTNMAIVAESRTIPSLKELSQMLFTFMLITVAWIFFRASSIEDAVGYCNKMISSSLFSVPTVRPTYLILLLIFFILVEWWGRRQKFALEQLRLQDKQFVRWVGLAFILLLTFIFNSPVEQKFIYFQF